MTFSSFVLHCVYKVNVNIFVLYLQKEWLCLNCQTQRALSGALGDSGTMLHPTHAPAKPETQTIPTTNVTEPKTVPIKVEPTTAATKQPAPIQTKTVEMPPSTKAKVEPETDKIETAQFVSSKQREPETIPTSISVKLSPSAAENPPCTSALEPLLPEAEMRNTKILGMTNVKSKDEIVVIDNATVISKLQEPNPDLLKTESDTQTRTSPVPRSEDKNVPIAPSAAKVAVSEVDPEKERKPKPPVPESIVAEVQASDQIRLKEPTHSLQQVQLPLKLQEQQLTKEAEPIMAAKSKDVVKTEEKSNNIISTQKSQRISTEDKLKVRIVFFFCFCLLFNKRYEVRSLEQMTRYKNIYYPLLIFVLFYLYPDKILKSFDTVKLCTHYFF